MRSRDSLCAGCRARISRKGRPSPIEIEPFEWEGESINFGTITLDWRAFPPDPPRADPGVYIIAKREVSGWKVLKVGEAVSLKQRLGGGSLTTGARTRYEDLRASGHICFYATDARGDKLRDEGKRRQLQHLLSRLLLRSHGLTNHSSPVAVITNVTSDTTIVNPLPSALADGGETLRRARQPDNPDTPRLQAAATRTRTLDQYRNDTGPNLRLTRRRTHLWELPSFDEL